MENTIGLFLLSFLAPLAFLALGDILVQAFGLIGEADCSPRHTARRISFLARALSTVGELSRPAPQGAVLGFVPSWVPREWFLGQFSVAPRHPRAAGPKGRCYRHGLSCSCLVTASKRWQVGVGGCYGTAPKPTNEVCNGKDDNCDGQIDEPAPVKEEIPRGTGSSRPRPGHRKLGKEASPKAGHHTRRRANKALKRAGTAPVPRKEREAIRATKMVVQKNNRIKASARREVRLDQILARSEERKAKAGRQAKVRSLANWAIEYASRSDRDFSLGRTESAQKWFGLAVDMAARAKVLAKEAGR